MMPKILLLCKYPVQGQRLITGVSKANIKLNVLNDLFEVIGSRNYDYNVQTGELRLFDTQWRVIGAKDEGSEKYLRGSTVGAAVSDELTLTPKSFTMMLLSRLSPPGARWYATTNPDNPYHYIKTDLIDNKDLVNDLETISLTLEDNPNLSEDYKAFIRRSYTGIWYKRFVLGLWVMAEGSIYGDVVGDDLFYDDDSRPVGLLSRGGHVERWLSIDVGTINAFAVGDFYDDGRTLWLERELYWDSRVQQRQKSNSEYAADLVNFVGNIPQREWPGVIIDPSAASFKVDLVSRGFYVIDAKNEVLEGIRRVSTMMAQRKLRIHRRCVNTIRELNTYSWDDKRAQNGTEQPIKKFDHAMDFLRYMISTRVNDWRLSL